MIQFYKPLSPNLPLLLWNLNTSQTKEQKQQSDWCKIHTLNYLIGARNIPLPPYANIDVIIIITIIIIIIIF